jgi:phage baseplate assembly protein V
LDVVASIMESLRKLRHRVDATVARVVIEKVNDALKTQRVTVSILAGETAPDVEHFQPYGLSFTPPVGSEAIGLAVAGARSHTLVICAQHPGERPTESPARTGGLYTNGEWRLYIDASGVVHLGAETGAEFVALAQLVRTQLDDIRAKFDAHIHTTTATLGLAGVAVVAPPTALMGPAQSVAASKVKAT